MAPTPDPNPVEDAVSLAAEWLHTASRLLTAGENRFQKKMAPLLTQAGDKVFLTEMIDQCFRSKNSARIGHQISYLFEINEMPGFFSAMDRVLIRLFLSLGVYLPGISVPLVINKIRKDSSRTIIQGGPRKLSACLARKKALGFRVNMNHLGEAVLGEAEALSRLNLYMKELKNPEIEEISVKISTLYSQVNPFAFDHTVQVVRQRLRELYRTAAANFFQNRDGSRKPKFVNLDMESRKDLEITVASFRAALEGADFRRCSAGIALQAYLPESFEIQRELTSWAKQRVAGGGAPIKIRIVKGANMEMEKVESALRNWPSATYSEKLDTDANFKRMVEFGLRPENIDAVSLGIASHNLFELAYAYKIARQNGLSGGFIFEMLTGMADHYCRAIRKFSMPLLLYAPYTTRSNFINAIAYLVRRLDENSTTGNFLRYSFNLKSTSSEWTFLKNQFIDSCRHMASVHQHPHRMQNRLKESFKNSSGTCSTGIFVNEPDTDWSLSANRAWADDIRKTWRKPENAKPLEIPLVVGGRERFKDRLAGECRDPSRFHENALIARYAAAAPADVENAMAAARNDPDLWRRKNLEERHAILSEVAVEVRRRRGDLIGAAAAETGKIVTEADVEVSEAIDFLEYYPYSLKELRLSENILPGSKGTGVVISPWNFPIAIPCGGITASLAAGNTVVFKPASDAVLTGWILCRAFWKAGVSRNTLQFLPCEGSSVGHTLAGHPMADFVIFTGGTETGLKILNQRPGICLAGETGGKNATIVTAMSDRDQAVKNVIDSAFGNGGQKCSATSLLILEKEVYEDEKFRKQLVDAAESFQTGSVWDFENKMGPLIRGPRGDLEKALTRLEPGETWALKPRNVQDNPHMWTPGIKWDVAPGSFTHMTEFFGPVLAVICAEDLEHAMELVNQTGYGLTSGLESLDEREHKKWTVGIKAGNLYINRSTTGAVTFRQPFGGMGKSALGSGIKAGGPNYVSQFMTFTEKGFPKIPDEDWDHPLLDLVRACRKKIDPEHRDIFETDLTKTGHAVKSYLYHAREEFKKEKDPFRLRGQHNLHRYLPVENVVIRLHPEDTLFEILARIAAATIAGCRVRISIPPELSHPAMDILESREMVNFLGKGKIVKENDAAVIDMISGGHRIRYAGPDRVPSQVLLAAAKTGSFIARSEVFMEGRLELLHYFRNQSICINYHRYGNLGRHGLENYSREET